MGPWLSARQTWKKMTWSSLTWQSSLWWPWQTKSSQRPSTSASKIAVSTRWPGKLTIVSSILTCSPLMLPMLTGCTWNWKSELSDRRRKSWRIRRSRMRSRSTRLSWTKAKDSPQLTASVDLKRSLLCSRIIRSKRGRILQTPCSNLLPRKTRDRLTLSCQPSNSS